MKKLILVCLFTIGVSVVSFAQGGFQQKTPAERTADLKTSLALNDDQAAKITVIFTARQKSIDSLTAAINGDYGSIMTKMQPITNATTAKIKAVLTPEQAVAYQKQVDALAERMRQMMQQGMGGGGGTTPPKQ